MTTTEKKKLGPTDCLTPEFRLSYPALFEARQPDTSKPEKLYGCEMIFRIAETEESKNRGEKVVSIETLKAAATAAIIEKWGADKTVWPKGLKIPFKKGTEGKAADKDGYGEGVIYVRTSRKEEFGAPVVVDQLVAPVVDKTLVYAGMYCRAKIHAYAWKHPTGGAGVSFTLDMLQLSRDGEPLGNKMSAADAFEPIAMPAAVQQKKEGLSDETEARKANDMFGDLV